MNSQVLKEPDFNEQSGLLRFREEFVARDADIEGMLSSIKVLSEDADLFRGWQSFFQSFIFYSKCTVKQNKNENKILQIISR